MKILPLAALALPLVLAAGAGAQPVNSFVSGPFTVTRLTFPTRAFLTPPTSTTGDFSKTTGGNGSTNPYGGSALDGAPYFNLTDGGTMTYVLPTPRRSFKLIWGTPDSYNRIDAYDSTGALIGTLDGGGVAANFGFSNGTYVQITTKTPIARLVASSSSCCFETGNQR